MSKTSKISLSVKETNKELLDLCDAYADRNKLSRSDFLFKLVRQYDYSNRGK
jgi:hypothetical protein